MRTSFIIVIFITLIAGCASPNPSTEWNKRLIKKKAPVRMIQDKSFTQKNATRYIEDWAGTIGTSAFNKEYKNRIFSDITKKCAYGENEFIETYIVKHESNAYGSLIEEVWLFKDPKSFREDKVSGLTIYLGYDKKTKTTTGNIFGACHTGRGTSITNID